MSLNSLVSIIIPDYSGDILLKCLERLYAGTRDLEFETIVVDDGPDNGELMQYIKKTYPAAFILATQRKGFGAACNAGLRRAAGKYAVLLNNDVEVEPGWLAPLTAAMEENPSLALCQPKILSLLEKGRFDRGGGAGGEMDVFGYPFALGSFVNHVERDHGRYDAPKKLFWAHGSAMMLRLSALNRIGFFDEEFYMQAEEIDLCCRALLGGFDIQSVPSSVVRHYFGWTFKRDTIERHYLSHRNTMVVVLKNWPMSRLIWVFPIRIALELMTMFYGIIFRGNWKQSAGVAMALGWLLTHPFNLIRRRRISLQNGRKDFRRMCDRMYRGSIIAAYFIGGIRTAERLRR